MLERRGWRRWRPVGDSLEDSDLVVGAFDAAVGDPAGLVEGEDLFAPDEEGLGELGGLGYPVFSVGAGEGAEGLVGGFRVLGDVYAVEVSELPPCGFELATGLRGPWARAAAWSGSRRSKRANRRVPRGAGRPVARGGGLRSSGAANHLATRGTVEDTGGVAQVSLGSPTACGIDPSVKCDLDASPPTAALFEQEPGRAPRRGGAPMTCNVSPVSPSTITVTYRWPRLRLVSSMRRAPAAAAAALRGYQVGPGSLLRRIRYRQGRPQRRDTPLDRHDRRLDESTGQARSSHGRGGPSPISGRAHPRTARRTRRRRTGGGPTTGSWGDPPSSGHGFPPAAGHGPWLWGVRSAGNGARSGCRRPRRSGAQVRSTTPTASGRRGPSSDASEVGSA